MYSTEPTENKKSVFCRKFLKTSKCYSTVTMHTLFEYALNTSTIRPEDLNRIFGNVRSAIDCVM